MTENRMWALSDDRIGMEEKRSRSHGVLTTAHFIVSLLFLSLSSAGAGPMPVPINLQVEIIKRMFNYDKALANEANPLVFVLYQDEGEVRPNDIVKAFEVAGLASLAVRLDALTSQSRRPSAVYLLPGIDTTPVRRYCTEHGVLSISGVPELAENGSVAVSIGEANNRPQIIVNRSRLQDEGHDFSAQLLRLARVVN